MPDDPEVTEEVAEPQDPDAIAGFDEAATETPPEGDDKPPEKEEAAEEKVEEVVVEKEPEKKAAEEKPSAEADAKATEEKVVEEEPTAKDRAEKRAADYEEPPKKEVSGEGEAAPKDTPPSKREPSPSQLTKEQVANYLQRINPDDLPDGELVIGNETVNVREFMESYPDQASAIAVLSNVIAEKVIEDKLASMDLVDSDTVKDLQDQLDGYAWWGEVLEVHSDAKKVNKSKEFNTWLDKQRLGIKAMAGANASPQDAIDVLDFYKEETAKANVAEHDDDLKKKKKKKDDLMKGVLKGKQTIPKTEAEIAADDERAGWEEGLKDESD